MPPKHSHRPAAETTLSVEPRSPPSTSEGGFFFVLTTGSSLKWSQPLEPPGIHACHKSGFCSHLRNLAAAVFMKCKSEACFCHKKTR